MTIDKHNDTPFGVPYPTTKFEFDAAPYARIAMAIDQVAERHFHPHHRVHKFLKLLATGYTERLASKDREILVLKSQLTLAETQASQLKTRQRIPATSGSVVNLTVNLPEGAGLSSRTIIVHPAENKNDVAITFEPSEQLMHKTATATLPVKPTKETAPAVALKVLEDAGYSIESDYSLGEAVRALKDHALAESVKSKSAQDIHTTQFGPFKRDDGGRWLDIRLSAELYNR